MKSAVKEASPEKLKSNVKKWGNSIVETGWTFVPNMLLERQGVLGINSTQLNILLVILKHWWEKDRLPFPEMNTIATSMRVSRSTVQKNIRLLEKWGLIKRNFRLAKNGGNTSNEYDFSGLVAKLNEYAQIELAARTTERANKAKRLTPKGNKPELKVVK